MRTQWLKRAAAIFCATHLTLLYAAEVPAQELSVKEFEAKTNTTTESMTQETESYADETKEITTHASDVLEQQTPEETQTEQETSAQLQESEQQTIVLPYESASERTLAVVGSCGYKTLGFNGYYADYDSRNQKPPQVAIDILNRSAFPGAVYCLHATSTTNAAILGSWIDHMRSIGYQFELFQR